MVVGIDYAQPDGFSIRHADGTPLCEPGKVGPPVVAGDGRIALTTAEWALEGLCRHGVGFSICTVCGTAEATFTGEIEPYEERRRTFADGLLGIGILVAIVATGLGLVAIFYFRSRGLL